MDDDTAGLATIVDARSCASTQVGAEPSDGVSIHGAFMHAAEEVGVVYGDEGLGKIHCHRHRLPRRTGLVEAADHLLGERQESSCAGALYPKTILGVCKLEVRSDEAEHELLHHLGGGA